MAVPRVQCDLSPNLGTRITAAAKIGCVIVVLIATLAIANQSAMAQNNGEGVAIELPSGMADVAGAAAEGEAAHLRALSNRQQMLIASLTIFVLAIFVGFEIITKVPPTLHTPLMSGSNAISGITVVGALIVSAAGQFGFAAILGTLAIVLAMINVVGGFLVTHRMLAMFKKK